MLIYIIDKKNHIIRHLLLSRVKLDQPKFKINKRIIVIIKIC